MHNDTWKRAMNTLGSLALSIILGGGLVSLVTLQPNPVLWPAVCRPLSLIIIFLFFQWLHRDEKCGNSGKPPKCGCGGNCSCGQ
jgi:hypothetical protein